MTRWILAPADKQAVDSLAVALRVPRPVARMLVARGYSDSAAATAFLESGLGSLGDPLLLDGMPEAIARIRLAIKRREKIAVYGDYDADGVTSTALLVKVLRALGADVVPFLPNRFDEGYGLTMDGLKRCLESVHPQLVITADCGSCSREVVDMAAAAGVDTIVTDHHEIHGELAGPIVVNPKRGDDTGLAVLAGVGVAFKLAHGLVKSLRADGDETAKGLDLRRYLDLVAVGTVADVAPLCGENRVLVRAGLGALSRAPCPGLAALMDKAGVRMPVDTRQIGFTIGPRLNAAGRLSDVGPEESLQLLMAESRDEAMPHAERLDRANQERRRIETRVLEQAMEQAPKERNPAAVAVGGAGWHAGTIGIVAARLCGRFKCPAAVVAMEADGSGKGSCRSVEGINVVDALSDCESHLETHGGHAMAAGFRLRPGAFDAFKESFLAACLARDTRGGVRSLLKIDAWIGFEEANSTLLDACGRCEPFGIGNPSPVWATRGVRVMGEPRILGGKHLSFRISDGRITLPAIGFYKSEESIARDPLDLVFRLAADTYKGRDTIQLQVLGWRGAEDPMRGTDDATDGGP